jgi:hypothetical protein
MPLRIYCVFLAILLCLNGFTNADVELEPSSFGWNAKKTNSNIIFDKDPIDTGAGSGGWNLPISDDEDLAESGSGSGSGMGVISPDVPLEKTTVLTTATTVTTASPTTGRPVTPCEKFKQASRQLSGRYLPRCLPNGEFDSFQCQGHPGSGDCWCSDLEGKEIPGTLMEAPGVPNCDTGNNLKPCIYQFVLQVRSKMLGSYRPKCTSDGQFELMQCHGSICFCVDETSGSRITGTEVHRPDNPNCDDESADMNTPESSTPVVLPDDKDKNEDIDIDEDIDDPKSTLTEETSETIDLDLEIGGNTNKGKDSSDTKTKFRENESKSDREQEVNRSDQEGQRSDKVEKASEIMTQPGILAGIIGGSVVLLLCVVLLVMFVVYRMRKKDEGSYPLDEPRKAPNYNYVRAPEKEFYA